MEVEFVKVEPEQLLVVVTRKEDALVDHFIGGSGTPSPVSFLGDLNLEVVDPLLFPFLLLLLPCFVQFFLLSFFL
jgi:hypothetical protein